MRVLLCLVALLSLLGSLQAARAEGDHPPLLTAILGATSDYVYRGVSQRDGEPTPLAYVSLRASSFYIDGFLIGVDLGDDALGRNIGTTESDLTVGFTPKLGNVEFNLGVKYTGYPNGHDVIAGSLDAAERDFIEPFAGATASLTNAFSLGATVFWTPNFYYEAGQVFTLEGKASLALPQIGLLSTKITAYAGRVHSDRDYVVSPGDGYSYCSIGLEGQIDRVVFDVRYWSTDVDQYKAFEDRLVISAGITY